ncbi:hypoxanthine phosphoribosyltransferase [Deferrisoma palaeochoriense]
MAERIRILYDETQIRRRVAELAREVDRDHRGVDELVLVGVLKGSFIFLADLARALTVPRRVDFLAVSTYPGETREPGAVRLLMDLRIDIAGRHVLLVEDIVDTGSTLAYLQGLLRARRPAALRTCVLLRKGARLGHDVTLHYVGFDIPDVWVVGYGLDYAERNRCLPYIGVVEPPEASASPA